MTVGELKAKIANVPDDTQICFWNDDLGVFDIFHAPIILDSRYGDEGGNLCFGCTTYLDGERL